MKEEALRQLNIAASCMMLWWLQENNVQLMDGVM